MIDLILLQPIPEHSLSSFSAHLFRRGRIHLKVEVSYGYPFCDTQMQLFYLTKASYRTLSTTKAWPVACPVFITVFYGQLVVFQHRVLNRVTGLKREEVAGYGKNYVGLNFVLWSDKMKVFQPQDGSSSKQKCIVGMRLFQFAHNTLLTLILCYPLPPSPPPRLTRLKLKRVIFPEVQTTHFCVY
jgi:hypothetical protein